MLPPLNPEKVLQSQFSVDVYEISDTKLRTPKFLGPDGIPSDISKGGGLIVTISFTGGYIKVTGLYISFWHPGTLIASHL